MRRVAVWMALLGCATAGLTSATIAAPAAGHVFGVARRVPLAPTGVPAAVPAPAATTTTTVLPPTPTTTTVALPSPEEQSAVAERVRQAVQGVVPDAEVAFEVFDRRTGAVLSSLDADQQFASMSVVKLLIALDALDGGQVPDEETQAQIRHMLAASDDAIADAFWGEDGGPALVTRMVNLLGLTGTQPPDDPGEWGDTLITAQDMVTVYRYITDQLAAAGRDLVLGALTDTQQIASDGFDQYFGIPDGLPHATWAVKQGWGTSGSRAVMNSTGLVGPDARYVTVLLTSASADSYGVLPGAVTAAAGALAGLLGSAAP